MRAARRPAGLPNVTPADWWRGLFTFLWFSGWRITETLSPVWNEVDLDRGWVVTLAETNKSGRDERLSPHARRARRGVRAAETNRSGRDERLPLHPLASEHLRRLAAAFTPEVFPWPHDLRGLYDEFARVEAAAGVKGSGFHDFRRSFATDNAESLGADVLQKMMRHSTYATTKVYIRMAEDLSAAVGKLFVPDVLTGKAQSGG